MLIVESNANQNTYTLSQYNENISIQTYTFRENKFILESVWCSMMIARYLYQFNTNDYKSKCSHIDLFKSQS